MRRWYTLRRLYNSKTHCSAHTVVAIVANAYGHGLDKVREVVQLCSKGASVDWEWIAMKEALIEEDVDDRVVVKVLEERTCMRACPI